MAIDKRRFVDRRGRPKLEQCAVLFIDLLGVREMNRSRRVASHLIELERAVSRSYRDLLGPDSPLPAAFFSDTLVLASPLPEWDEEFTVADLIRQAAWLQHELVEAGFFVRGGLSIGKLHIRDGLVFGPALADAYDLENEKAIHPRIVLSDEVVDSQRKAIRSYSRAEYAPQSTLLLCDDDGHTFVNYLGVQFDETEDPEPALEKHRDTLIARLDEHQGTRRRWEKYRWVAEYHNDVVRRALPDAEELCVPAVRITWKFRSFA